MDYKVIAASYSHNDEKVAQFCLKMLNNLLALCADVKQFVAVENQDFTKKIKP